jgi:hemin uptake protein HemP
MPPNRDTSATQGDGGGNPVRRIEVRELFGSNREVILIHNGQCYRLRITSSGKLILTK